MHINNKPCRFHEIISSHVKFLGFPHNAGFIKWLKSISIKTNPLVNMAFQKPFIAHMCGDIFCALISLLLIISYGGVLLICNGWLLITNYEIISAI